MKLHHCTGLIGEIEELSSVILPFLQYIIDEASYTGY